MNIKWIFYPGTKIIDAVRKSLILLFALTSSWAMAQNSDLVGGDCNPKLNRHEIAYFDSLFSNEKYDFQNHSIGFASPNILHVFGLIPMPPGFNNQLLAISKKEYFAELSKDVKHKKRSKLLVLPDSLKAKSKGFDAIVLLVPAKKLKKVNSKTPVRVATSFGFRSLNYPDNLSRVGTDTTTMLTDEEVKFFNQIYQHHTPDVDFKNKRIVVVDYYSKKMEQKSDYINRIKKHLEKDFLYPDDDLIFLTESEREETGIDIAILLPEKMIIREELLTIIKNNNGRTISH